MLEAVETTCGLSQLSLLVVHDYLARLKRSSSCARLSAAGPAESDVDTCDAFAGLSSCPAVHNDTESLRCIYICIRQERCK